MKLQTQQERTKITFVKNGSPYYLQKIDCNGNPVYINTKNRESGAIIKVHQLCKNSGNRISKVP